MASVLEQQYKYVYDRSAFYRKKYSASKNEPGCMNEIPFTTKAELLYDQKINPPFGSNLCIPVIKIKRIHKTSGTILSPLLIVLTERDIDETVKIGRRCFQLSGLQEEDVVIHCLNYNMWMGGYTDHQSLEATGAAVIPFGVGNTRNLIETIVTIRPTAIHCTPSYLAKIEAVLLQEFNMKPMNLGLKLGLFGAESGLQNPTFRDNIERKWGITAMNANYGMADVLSMFGAECYMKNGLHFMGSEALFPELIDPETLEKMPISSGNHGELVLTNLIREAQPVIRYRTGDIIKVLSTDKCPCGSDGFKFEVIGRTDDMFVVKGVNVFVSSIENIVAHYIDILSGVFQIHINKGQPVDKVHLIVELKSQRGSCSELSLIDLEEKMLRDLKTKVNISPEIIFQAYGTLPRTSGKSKKLFKTL